MKIVLDTNILLVSFSGKSALHWVWESLLDNRFTLCATTDILLEYEEIIGRHLGQEMANAVMDAIIDLPNLQLVSKYIFWHLIDKDSDDNKFVDCAIACNAKYIVSEDRHFNVLKEIPFPKVDVIGVEEFRQEMETLKR